MTMKEYSRDLDFNLLSCLGCLDARELGSRIESEIN